LLREDSEEEDEGDLCRICLIPGGTPLNPLLEPCKCVGSLQFVHHDCLKKWLQAKIISGADLAAVTTCELCKQTLKLDFDNFDVHEFHRKRAASQVEEQMTSSSLYMAVLLHLYEQRFTELIRLLGGSATTYQ
ncbi:probable E3 ubiquitin-protein ligase MARCHF10, partial [Chiloscyllium plagiosum]|uniref:probable E3 ubiquitin-protein ligase MARCHF10 n=1 Tax=Chiloscyllium plagiosum TaxID=36176 RepID=UPI001CB7EC2E